MSKNIFVFVVCGTLEHIDTLHLSLQYLKKYSKNEIYIITDSARNETPIIHENIIDIKTDEKFNNHQASIYLKTGIHKFLPLGNNYCYLDTDVVAVSADCDNIFNEFVAPITFAPDHCKVRKFSAYAVNCSCLTNRTSDRDKFNKYMDDIKKSTIFEPHLIDKNKELQAEFDKIKKSLVTKTTTAIRYFTSYPIFKFNEQFYFDKKKRTWHIASGEIIMHEVNVERIQEATGLKYNKWNQKWLNKQGEDIWQDECNHLVENIKSTFDINIIDKNWQHWNGGVFLFNDLSHKFLDAWHNKTMHIFNLPEWKTRDQGTLITTAWEFGLQNHPTLSKKWNFIADFYNINLGLKPTENIITDDGFNTSYNPAFVHVYHHWKNQDWIIWQWIETKL
ncbi:MAG: hypothetical protein KBE91_06265 [Bacteroidia bacterium]|nr:hypothetical protein [Bacteroidia bacterium]